MSSTNRGYDRHASDYYVTSVEQIVNFLQHFSADENTDFTYRKILDPCAGGSDKDEMSYARAFGRSGIVISTMDIRPDSKAKIIADYVTCKYLSAQLFDTIITNPPFYLALSIIQKAIADVAEGGYVVMLLRLNFFGSVERNPFFKSHMPKYCYVHHKRMNFIPKWVNDKLKAEGKKPKTGDSIEYAHFVWQKGHAPEFTKLKVI